MSKAQKYTLPLIGLIGILSLSNLLVGSVSIPFLDVLQILSGKEGYKDSWQFIIWQARLPQALVALFCGAALAVSGLMLQTAFRNPLAGPSIFGISSGAALGVAVVLLLFGGSISIENFSFTGFVAILFAAFIGAMAVTCIIFLFSKWVRNSVMLLIIGMMIGYLSSSAISLLNFFATDEGVKSYLVWGMGSFAGVSMSNIPFFIGSIMMGLTGALLLIKPLNILLLGEEYAESLGVNTNSIRNRLLLITGLLTAITTAFCGPIAFIGLAVPHIARMITRTDNLRLLMPITLLAGAVVALLCNILCYLPGENGILPLNVVTPLIGAPTIIYVVYQKR